MQEVKSDIMTFRGSHFDLGIKTAQWLKQTPLLDNREREWKKRIPRLTLMLMKHIAFSKRMHQKSGKNY